MIPQCLNFSPSWFSVTLGSNCERLLAHHLKQKRGTYVANKDIRKFAILADLGLDLVFLRRNLELLSDLHRLSLVVGERYFLALGPTSAFPGCGRGGFRYRLGLIVKNCDL